MKKKLVILISGTGTNMLAVITACKEKRINADVVAVISSNHTAAGIKKAESEGIPAFVFPLVDYTSQQERDQKILETAKRYHADFLVLAGYLGILSEGLCAYYKKRIINIHPALLPKYGGKGFFGINVHNAVIENGDKISGATVHYADKGIDTGEIIASRSLKVLSNDTAETLRERILTQIEPYLLIDVLKDLCKD